MFLSLIILTTAIVLPNYIEVYSLVQILLYSTSAFQLAAIFQRTSKKKKESISRKDALQFPLTASLFLCGAFLVLKTVKAEYTNLILTLYFSVVGALAVHEQLTTLIFPQWLPKSLSSNAWFTLDLSKRKFLGAAVSLLGISQTLPFTAANLLSITFSATIGTAYFRHKTVVLNNFIAIAFVLKFFEDVVVDSFSNSVLLLSGLFCYDVFWVYGSSVMATVATKLDVPIKLLLPRPDKKPGLLGLGDLVVPGLHLMLLERFAEKKNDRSFFIVGVWAYSFGMTLCYWALETWQTGQPALFFLVPILLLSSVLIALYKKCFLELLWYKENDQNPSE